jgi:hypothetical protein
MTQSTPALASTLETLAPGSICQNPMAGRRAAPKTCFSRLDLSMLLDAMVDIEQWGVNGC